jgi:hypothetical protein
LLKEKLRMLAYVALGLSSTFLLHYLELFHDETGIMSILIITFTPFMLSTLLMPIFYWLRKKKRFLNARDRFFEFIGYLIAAIKDAALFAIGVLIFIFGSIINQCRESISEYDDPAKLLLLLLAVAIFFFLFLAETASQPIEIDE